MYTDSHCHITDDSLYNRIDEIMENCFSQNVSNLMVICCKETDFIRACSLKEKYPFIRIAFGWFPGDAKEIAESHFKILEKNIDKIDCIGEIGLDYYWDDSFKEEQKSIFIKQILLANQYQKPIAIHMRSATKDTLDILKEYAQTKILFHCFSGSKETMMECLKLNSYISFAGPITFKNARQAPECIINCPVDHLLTETDSPYLSPVPFRGKQNEHKNVQYVVKKICELKQIEETVLCSQIEKNFYSFFNKD